MTTRVHHTSLPLALVAFLLAFAPSARALTIDFESLADGEFVTNQFAASGISFSNAITLVAGSTLNEIDFPPSSGSNVISGLAAGAIGVSFLQPVQLVSLQLTTADVAAVSFYDSANVLLGQILVNPNLGGNTLVSFSSASSSIAGITIASQAAGSASFLTVDDLDFQPGSSPPVPEPSAFLAMAAGLGMAASALRRRA